MDAFRGEGGKSKKKTIAATLNAESQAQPGSVGTRNHVVVGPSVQQLVYVIEIH